MLQTSIAIINIPNFCRHNIQCGVLVESPYGVYCPFIQNSMPRDPFEFMCRFMNFSDSGYQNDKWNLK